MNLKFTIASLFVLVQAISAQPLNTSLNFKIRTISAYDEKNPVISPDGKTLYLTIANHPSNLGGKKDPGDIWFCTLGENNEWSEPVHGGSLINDRSYNGIAGFSFDGSEMILLGHYDPAGNLPRTQGISVAKKNGNLWSRPQNVSIPYFQNKSSLISGYITPDQKYFVFSAETYGSYGVEDLFVCQRKSDGKWSEPKNLGSKINTQFQELCPSLSMDGKTLFFSTNGRKGQGSFDVFSATRLDDTWMNWSEPENIATVNSPGRDLYYREYPLSGYALYTSTNDSDNYGEIKLYKPATPLPIDSAALVQPVLVEVKPPVTTTAAPGTIKVHGKVLNGKTGESISALITFESESDFVKAPAPVNAVPTGFEVTVPSTTQYVVRIESKGFISARERLDIQTYEMQELEMNFKLQPIEVGTTVNLKDVLFEQSKTTLLPQSYPELDLVVSFMKENPEVKIELSGHTDNRGVPFQNVKLSQGRVDTVRDYLISKGIDAKRISGKGYGGTKPIASNNEEETRKLNRRVEFTIRKN
jgi:OmpA-OmpF porin, OOP family